MRGLTHINPSLMTQRNKYALFAHTEAEQGVLVRLTFPIAVGQGTLIAANGRLRHCQLLILIALPHGAPTIACSLKCPALSKHKPESLAPLLGSAAGMNAKDLLAL